MLIMFTMVGTTKKSTHDWQVLFLALVSTCILTSCVNKYTMFTDVYYVTNATDSTLRILTENSIVWDTCATNNLQHVWYNSGCVQIKPHKTIRLHPISREYKHMHAEDRMNIVTAIGKSAKLIIGTDTIQWSVTNPYMFTDTRTWSIYNTECWQTVEDKQVPYTFYHTFTISTDDIERSLL